MSDNRSEEKVIIIGNSPSILLQEYGELIDSYDVVIRVNRCVTKGFEKYIGKKIDIWATTRTDRAIDHYVPENYKDIKYLWVRTEKSIRGYINKKEKLIREKLKSLEHIRVPASHHISQKKKKLQTKLNELNPKGQTIILPKDFPREVIEKRYTMYKQQKWFRNYKTFLNPFKFKREPCTGLLTILTACRFYDDITVHGFTFGLQSDSEHRLSGYYRESELKPNYNGNHVHTEDSLWFSDRNLKWGGSTEGDKRRNVLKTLVKSGIPKKPEGDKNGFQVAHPPIKILNKEELGDMNL